MALVLSRQLNETVCIGDDIFVTVLELRGDKVRLAITAPKSTVVDRLEIATRKRAEKSRVSPAE